MKDKLLVFQIREPNSDGVTLIFNDEVILSGNKKSKEWFVSWDFIGRAILGKKYCSESEAIEIRKRGVN